MGEQVLSDVARAAQLREGPEGVRQLLCAVHRHGPLPLAQLARQLRLPVPVVAAVRRELEKRDLLRREGGVALSGRGARLIGEDLGVRTAAAFGCRHCGGTRVEVPPSLAPVAATLEQHLRGRPSPDLALDQSHGTPQTALRRALYVHDRAAVEGRRVLLLGDDDLASVALALLLRELGAAAAGITVLDTDPRVLGYIAEVARCEGLAITCRQHDLCRPLPSGHAGAFDTFLTDPPYTRAGARLFVSRGVAALRPGPGGQGFLCFAHKTADVMVQVLADLAAMGLQTDEIIPGFNDYEGAAVLAHCSQMIHLITTTHTRPAVSGPCEAPIYTRSEATVRRRRCRQCGRRVAVGPGAPFANAEALRERGCPQCGGRRFEYSR